jgi:predicted transcriptional regulator
MNTFSTRQAAQRLGITHAALSKYISAKKIPAPKAITSGGMTIHLWTEEDIERLRQLLPKIANGRKTRYEKKQSAISTQQSAKTKAQPRAAVPHKQRKPKKKK